MYCAKQRHDALQEYFIYGGFKTLPFGLDVYIFKQVCGIEKPDFLSVSVCSRPVKIQ